MSAALYPAARETIRDAGMSVSAYVREWCGPGAPWRGDACGCPDDRCIGHHHDAHEQCECLPTVLQQMTSAAEAGA